VCLLDPLTVLHVRDGEEGANFGSGGHSSQEKEKGGGERLPGFSQKLAGCDFGRGLTQEKRVRGEKISVSLSWRGGGWGEMKSS